VSERERVNQPPLPISKLNAAGNGYSTFQRGNLISREVEAASSPECFRG
jgi:hypothetical protein